VINGSSQIPILTGGVGNATITPSSSGVLAFTDDGKITQSAGAIEIGGLALLADGASYEVIENLALTIAVSSSLTLGDAAALILDHDGSDAAALKGTGELIAGGTKIVGGTGGWEAGSSSGALSIIISPDSIKGTTVNASLAGAGSGAGIEVVATGNLALVENIKIDLSTEGTITIREGGVITLSAASSSIIATNTSNASGNGTTITNITPSGDIGYSSTEAGANDTLESINTSSTGTLTGTTGDATIAKTTTVS
jgi:hypothetical protein